MTFDPRWRVQSPVQSHSPSLDHIQITTSLGELRRHGFVWVHGDRFRYRTWLGLRLIDPEAARLYFNTTREG